MLGRQGVLAMLDGESVESLPLMPITMMFAADHIGVPYREYATDFETLVEGQIRVAADFDFDYVSCISDPAREAADCGANVQYFEDQPPAMDESAALLTEKEDLARLCIPDPEDEGRMLDRVRAAELFRARLPEHGKLIEGWVEGPIAEAADLRGINNLMMDFYEDPCFVGELMEFTLELGIRFARAQVEAGVDIIGLGDAAASLVGPDIYESYVWPYEKRLVDAIKEMGSRVRLHICGDTRPILARMGELRCDIVDIDFLVPLGMAREQMGPDTVLLGNLNPVACLRNGTPEMVRRELERCHAEAGRNYIVGAGCEVVRDTAHENVRTMVKFARSHSLGRQ